MATDNYHHEQQMAFRPPVASTFSFSMADLWRPKGSSVLRWLNDVPTVPSRDELPEPARIDRHRKHALDPIDNHDNSSTASSDGAGCSRDEHRNKRARRSSILEPHPALGPNHHSSNDGSRLLRSGRGAVRRVSNICQSLAGLSLDGRDSSKMNSSSNYSLTPAVASGHGTPYTTEHRKSRGSAVFPLEGNGSPPGTPSTIPGERQRMRFVFVGDSACGKSSLLLRYYRDTFNQSWIPTQYELFSKTIQVDNQEVDIEMWDTSGKVNLHQLQLLSYLAWDAVFLCFSVNSQRRFENAKTNWAAEIRKHCRDAPVIMLGLKKDLRSGSAEWSRLYNRAWETRVGASEGTMAANILGAVSYLECSARTGEGVNEVFEEGVRVVQDELAADAEAVRMNRKGRKHRQQKSEKRRLSAFMNQAFCFAPVNNM